MGGTSSVFEYLKGSYRGGRRLSGHKKTRGNRYVLHLERFHLSIRQTFFTVRTFNGTT